MESLGLQIKHRFTRGCKVMIFQTFAEVRHQATETLLVYLRSFLLHLPSFFSFCLSLSFYLPSSLAPHFTDLFLCLLSSSAFSRSSPPPLLFLHSQTVMESVANMLLRTGGRRVQKTADLCLPGTCNPLAELLTRVTA